MSGVIICKSYENSLFNVKLDKNIQKQIDQKKQLSQQSKKTVRPQNSFAKYLDQQYLPCSIKFDELKQQQLEQNPQNYNQQQPQFQYQYNEHFVNEINQKQNILPVQVKSFVPIDVYNQYTENSQQMYDFNSEFKPNNKKKNSWQPQNSFTTSPVDFNQKLILEKQKQIATDFQFQKQFIKLNERPCKSAQSYKVLQAQSDVHDVSFSQDFVNNKQKVETKKQNSPMKIRCRSAIK